MNGSTRRANLTGRKFGRLTVLGYAETRKGVAFWMCRCDCGTVKTVRTQKLTNGNTQSCGCQKADRASGRRVDHTGKRFGRLVAELYVRGPASKSYWVCRCDCGNYVNVKAGYLVADDTKSCGCLRLEVLRDGRKKLVKHGMWKTPEFTVWQGMKARCYNPNAFGYHRYGGRGIVVCGRWRESFTAFREDMGERPGDGYEIDRASNDGGYTCGKCDECLANNWTANCRWATQTQQARNRDDCRMITIDGETLPVAEWAERRGVRPARIISRLNYGWPPDLAVRAPAGSRLDSLGAERGPVNECFVARARAVAAVGRAIRDGKMARQTTCQFPDCGSDDNVQAHHYAGYEPENQLKVVFLCIGHHQQAATDPSVSERALGDYR